MRSADVTAKLPEDDRERLRSRAAVGDDADAEESIEVTAPYTGEVIGTVPAGTAADVEAAVDRARAAQTEWADRSVAERAAVVREAGERILDDRGRLMDVVQAESGKARFDALEEVGDVGITAEYYAGVAESVLSPTRRRGAVPLLTRTTEHRHPVGVVGLVEPWNYPLTLAISDALPALLAGNAVVLKPAAETPFTALAAVELCHEAGIPRDVFQVVTGHGRPVGEAIVERADFVGFTGSVETGRHIGTIAGERLVDCSLELGGKNPAIVCADAPLGRTTTGLRRACFANAGQLCVSIERIYVEEACYEAFLERFTEAVEGLTVGATFDYEADVGSLVSADQLERVEAHLEDAVERGARVVCGGERREDVGPWFFEPTVLADVPPAADLVDEETFGPVIRVESVPDVETAVEHANDSRYGLHASVWTGDRERGRDIATRIDCGTVAVNDAHVAAWGSTGAPMGGMKESGVGRRHGREGLTKYTESQTVAVQRGHPIARPDGVPRRLNARAFTAFATVKRWLDRRRP